MRKVRAPPTAASTSAWPGAPWPGCARPRRPIVQSSNPALTSDSFTQFAWADRRSGVMTIQGTVAKTALLLAILSATALWSWTEASRGGLNPAIFIGSAIGGFVVALVTIFRPTVSPYSAPLYAGLEGVFLGALSYFVEQQ